MAITSGHLPEYNRDDLTTKAFFKKRRWRLNSERTYECGAPMTAENLNAQTRRYTTCQQCQQAYDQWFQSMVNSEDLHDRVRMIHLIGTSMDPRGTGRKL